MPFILQKQVFAMTDSRKKLKVAIAGSSAVLAMASYTAHAADEFIQEVVVTAQKRQESLQTTPIAISAFSAEILKARGITDFAGVAENTPSVSFSRYPTSSQELIMYMRGQGVSDPAQITSDGSVGIYEDGFYIARPQFITFDLADIERVEVLRGPQGTLYGRNTTGGAVNIISKKPSGVFDMKEDVDFGNRNYFRSMTSVDLPTWNGLSTKFTALVSKKDGYVKNIGPSNDFGVDNQRAGRFALHWEGDSAFQVDYFFETARAEATPIYWNTPSLVGVVPGYDSNAKPNDHTWRPIDLPLSVNKFTQNGLTLTWNINDALTIKSLTGYRTARNDVDTDLAEAFSSPFSGGFITAFAVTDHYKNHQFTQELQAIGELFNHRVKYVAGLYYFDERGTHFENVRINVGAVGATPVYSESDLRDVAAQSKSKAAYAQATWTPPILDDKLSLTVGARYTKDDRSAQRTFIFEIPPGTPAVSDIGASNSQHFSKFNPAATLAYNWSDDVNTYLRVATGYKAGGSSEPIAPGSFGITFGPEKITSYELGLKSYAFDRHVRLNVALFESKFEDMQLFFQSNPANLALGQAINAGKATVRGAELDLLWAPLEDLNLTAAYTYLDSKFDSVIAPAGTTLDPAVNPASPYQVGDNVRDLFALPYAPKNSFNFGANYTFLHLTGSELSFNVNYRWEDRIFMTSPAGPAVPGRYLYSRPPYGLADARITWAFDLKDNSKARVSLWSKNITDKAYRQYTNGLGGSFLPLPGQAAGYVYQTEVWGEPRTFGINLVYEY